MTTNRRKFLITTGLSASGLMLGGAMTTCTHDKKSTPMEYDIMSEVFRFRKFDSHAHVGFEKDDAEKQIDIADRLGIDKLCISRPVTNWSGKEKEGPEEVRKANDVVIDAMKKFPDRYIGFVTLNPMYQKESMEELKRCFDEGMVGYKGYTQVKFSDPLYYPIIEQFVERNMIMLMHAFVQLGVGGYRMKYDVGQSPHTTIPEDIVDIAQRYPEGMFQYSHIGGGGDWEYACKLFRDYPNIYVDTSGSNNEEYMINFAMAHVGEDRMLFGCDGSFYQGVGKIHSAVLSDLQKKKIYFDNFNDVLRRSGNHVG